MTINAKFPHIAQSVQAHQSVEITGAVYVGENCQLAESVRLDARGARLVIGNHTTIGSSSHIWADEARTKIGEYVNIGENCDISGSIGDHTTVGNNITIDSSVNIGRNCIIIADQSLSNITIPDNSKVVDGEIV